ncbi:MAG: hypothetical protein ACRCTA_01775, partial [Bacilli bacterium]
SLKLNTKQLNAINDLVTNIRMWQETTLSLAELLNDILLHYDLLQSFDNHDLEYQRKQDNINELVNYA